MRKLLALGTVVLGLLLARTTPAWAQTALPRAGWVGNASSSNGGDTPSKVFDSNTGTRWSSGANQSQGQWFTVDMLTPQTFSQVTVDVAGNTTDYARGYEIYVSNDAVTWTGPVASGTGAPGIMTAVFPNQTGRFVSIVQTGTASGNWWSIAELNVYSGTVPTAPLPTTGWTATASVNGSGNTPPKAIDGVLSTRFSTGINQASGQWLKVDMGSAQVVAGLKMDADVSTTDYPRAYQIFASSDGTNWGSAIASGTGTSSPTTVLFAQTTTRYLKVQLTATASNWWSVAELSVLTPTAFTPTAAVLPRLGWTATASSSSGSSTPDKSLDDNGATRWTTGINQASGQFLKLDLLAPRSFTKVTLDAGSGNSGDYPRSYQVFVSNDGSTWGSAIATGTGASQVVMAVFPQQSARYVEVVLTGASSTNAWSVAEVNVYGVPPAVLPRQGWTATASLNSSNAKLGIDGNVSTEWSTSAAQVNGQSFQIDMKAPRSFNEITLDVQCNPSDYPRGYQVFATNNPASWGSPIASGSGFASMVAVAFAPQTARYLKVVQTSTASNYWGLAELNVLNTNPATCSTTCVALDACHDVGVCDASTGVCSNPAKANGTSCDDGNLCTRVDSCQVGVCTGSNPATCAALDACHGAGMCNTSSGLCTNPLKPVGTSCGDGNACNGAETCDASGSCQPGTPVVCPAQDQCHDVGICDQGTGACSNPVKPVGTSCGDGNACNGTETCDASGTCQPGTPVICTAQDQCHGAGICDQGTGACSNPVKPVGTSCGDGNACNGAETCDAAGSCQPGTPVVCTARDQCHGVGSCDQATGACSNPVKPAGTSCGDGNACNGTETCDAAGSCQPGTPVVCTAQDQCHGVGTCDQTTGVCSKPVKLVGTSCGDGNACNGAETCDAAGSCQPGTPVVCTARDQCHGVGSCDQATGACSNPVKPAGTSCGDGNACNGAETCDAAGSCQPGTPVVCTAQDQCHGVGTCDQTTGVCSKPVKPVGTSCGDGNACNGAETCDAAGSCQPGTPVVCTAQDQCHGVGTCDQGTGVCSNPVKPAGTSCGDGNACNGAETCDAAGSCQPGTPVVCTAQDQCHGVGTCDQTTGVCSNPPKANGASCDDGNSCTTADTCQSGTCSGASSCDKLNLTQNVFQVFTSPNLTFTSFSGSRTAVTPGDPVVYTGVFNNVGNFLQIGNVVTLQNAGTSAFTVGGFKVMAEVFSPTLSAWVPFGGVAYDASFNSILDPSLAKLAFDEYLPSGPVNTVVGPKPVVGAVVGVGGSITWHITMSANLTPDQVHALLNATGTSQVRIVTTFDTPAAPSPTNSITQDVTTKLAGDTGAAKNVRMHTIYSTIAPMVVDLTFAGPLDAGQSTTISGTIVTPLIAPKGATETDAQYIARLRNDNASNYGVSATGLAEAVGGSNPGQFYPPNNWSLTLLIPTLTVTKTGPATSGVGQTLDYLVAVINEGRAQLNGMSVTDSVDGAIVAGPTPVPGIVEPLIGRLATTISYQVPPTRGGGPMTDVAAVTWTDLNGNVYGPMTGTFTTNLIAGSVNDPGPHITSAPVTRLVRTTEDSQGVPFDLRSWTKVQYEFNIQPDAAWVIDPTGTVATETVNADSAILLSNIPVTNGHVEGTWIVNAADDDDFVGFVFGYQDSGHYYLFDWKEATQDAGAVNGIAYQGMSVKVASATTPLIANDLWPTSGNGARVRTLYHNSVAWAHFQPYTFSLDFQPGHFVITVKQGTTTLATIPIDDSTYAGGAFGFYNNSQDGVMYSGFSHDQLDSETYHYQVVATDPDGDPINYKLLSAPTGMTIDPVSGLISWLTQPGAGAYLVSVEAIDAAGLTDVQTYTVTVEDNHSPIVDAGPDQQLLGVTFPATATLAGSVSDELVPGDPSLIVTWSKVSGPGTVTFANGSSPTTTAMFSDIGTYVLQLAATDGVTTGADFVTIFVDSQPSLAGAALSLVASSAGPIQDGNSVTLTATLKDSGGHPMKSVPMQFDVVGANAQGAVIATDATGVAHFTYSGFAVGSDVDSATALGAGGAPTDTLPAIVWTAPPPAEPVATQGWIGSPLQQATVMGLVPIKIAAGVTLTSGTITYWPSSAPDQAHTLATGVSGGPGDTIATLDTTVLSNGSWILKLDATNDAGASQVNLVLLTVSGDYKPGRVVVEVTDMTVPVPGLPVTVGRRYDSLEKDRVGDFGHGWSLSMGHPRLDVDDAHNVTLTMLDNRRVTFYFAPVFPSAGPIVFGFFLIPRYKAEPGVYGNLTANGCPVLAFNPYAAVSTPACFGALSPEDLPYAPTTYTYTDPYGRVFTMGATGELKSIADRQQNVLTFTSAGISSNAGVNVAFDRDASGRIVKLTSPPLDSSNSTVVFTYEYDPAGDLVKVNLPDVGNGPSSWRYSYGADHRLLVEKDANGNSAKVATYDADGRLLNETDAVGNITTYAYDVLAHKTTTTNPDLGLVEQIFDERGLVLNETDALGRTTSHSYDANRNELTHTNALGEVTTFTYDANGSQTSNKNPRGDTVTATYNAFALPRTSIDPEGHKASVTYDDADGVDGVNPTKLTDEIGLLTSSVPSDHGLPLSDTDVAGNTAYMVYDAAGNLLARTDRLGRRTSYGYDGIGRRTSVTDPRGGTTTSAYYDRGVLRQTTDARGFVSSYQYDNTGNPLVEDTSDGRRTSFSYNALNQVTQVRHGDNTASQYTRDFRGNILTQTDESGRTTTNEYDKAGQLTKTTFADGTTQTRSYDALGRVLSIADERGNASAFEYESGCDCAQRITKVTDALGRATAMTYDGLGRRASLTDPAGHSTNFHYNVRGQLVGIDHADGTTESSDYDSAGRLIKHTDQEGKSTHFGYDAEGQLTSVTDALGNVTQFQYDENGNKILVSDPNNHVTTYEYDAVGNKTNRTLPLGMFETFSYDQYKDLKEHLDFRGKRTVLSYDLRQRLLTKVPDPSLGEPTITFAYNPTGTRATMVDASGTTTYAYDSRDRPISKGAPAGTLTYTYDAAGNLATVRSSNVNGTSVDYGWDAANQLSEVTDNRTGGVIKMTYEASGRPSSIVQPGDVMGSYSYDDVNRVTSMAWKRSDGSTFANWTYSFNGRGQRLSATDVSGRTASYSYDATARLVGETVSGDAVNNGSITYSFDGAGNRLSRTSSLAPVLSATYEFDANDGLAGDGYDPNGDTTSSGGHSFAYDFENRLRSKDSGNVKLVYDGDGNRVAKIVGGQTVRYLVDDRNPTSLSQVLEEVTAAGVQVVYVYGDALASETRNPGPGPQTSYYEHDAHGNVCALTDEIGNVANTYVYDAWGKSLVATETRPNNRTYSGYEYDSDVRAFNLRARYYSEDVGRFMSIDPIEDESISPPFHGRYTYAVGDPLEYRDPTGFPELIEDEADREAQKKLTTWVYKFIKKGQCYIGITVDIERRRGEHARNLFKELGPAFDKSKFYLEPLAEVGTPLARAAEQSVINFLLGVGGVPDASQALIGNRINSVANLAGEWDAFEAESALAGIVGGEKTLEITEKIKDCIKNR